MDARRVWEVIVDVLTINVLHWVEKQPTLEQSMGAKLEFFFFHVGWGGVDFPFKLARRTSAAWQRGAGATSRKLADTLSAPGKGCGCGLMTLKKRPRRCVWPPARRLA